MMSGNRQRSQALSFFCQVQMIQAFLGDSQSEGLASMGLV